MKKAKKEEMAQVLWVAYRPAEWRLVDGVEKYFRSTVEMAIESPSLGRQVFPMYFWKKVLGRLTKRRQEAIVDTAPNEVVVRLVGKKWSVAPTSGFAGWSEWVESVKARIPQYPKPKKDIEEIKESPSTKRVEWEILPPGPGGEIPKGIIPGKNNNRKGKTKVRRMERIRALADLQPDAWAVGRYLGKREYLVALFEGLGWAVAECYTFGNAVYASPVDKWQEVFKGNKEEALEAGAQKIVHRGEWEVRLVGLLTRP